MEQLGEIYHPAYHDVKNVGSVAAARSILPLVFDLVAVDSVLDVGCGAGTWLLAARELGASKLIGVEGEWGVEWLDQGILTSSDFRLVTQNLEDRFDVGRAFDLAMCLEVAEHLPESRAASLVEDLCRASKLVLFAAAIPGQGGTRHINEQWQSYWAELFQKQGFTAVDFIRTRVWGDDSIPFWYRQNTILYIRNSERERIASRLTLPPFTQPEALDMVHPILFEIRTRTVGARISASNTARLYRRITRSIRRRLR